MTYRRPRPSPLFATAVLVCAALALPSIAFACDNDRHWGRGADNNTYDSSSERARIKAYERQLENQRKRAAEKAAEKARELERVRLLEQERERAVQSRTFLYRRSPRQERRRARRWDSSSRNWDHGFERRGEGYSKRRGHRYSKPQLGSRKLAGVMEALADESFTQGQLAVITETGRRFEITVSQAIRMVSVLSFDKDRVEALAGLYPSLVDPDNFTTVYRLLTFSSDRKELRGRVRQMS